MQAPTKDHGIIRAWATRNDAVPAEITPRKFDGEPAILHFLFGNAKAGLEEILPISWESFFAQFDLLGLMIVFDDSPTFQIVHDERTPIYGSTSSLS